MSTAAVTQEAINIKDDINSMIATIAGMQATAGMKTTKLLQLYHLHRRDTNNSTNNAGTPTTVWLPLLKTCQKAKKFTKKLKKSKKCPFLA
jgi:hypothetical protein